MSRPQKPFKNIMQIILIRLNKPRVLLIEIGLHNYVILEAAKSFFAT